MQQRIPSTNDNLTLVGLLGPGLTSALVGALVVAPTLAPKRMALAVEKPKEPAKPSPPVTSDALEAALRGAGISDPSQIPPSTISGALGFGNVPGANAPASNAPDELLANSPVTIRTPEEPAGPPAPSNSESATDENTRRRDVKPDDNSSPSDEDTGSTSRRNRRNRRDAEDEPAPSERARPEAAPTTEGAKPEPPKEDDSKPDDEGGDAGKSAEDKRVFRVQSGKFNTREEALKVQHELAKTGKGGFIVPAGDGFRLQLGVFQSRENAEKAAENARGQNIIVDVRQERQAQR